MWSEFTYMTPDEDAFVKAAMNIRVPYKVKNFLIVRAIIILS